MSSYYSDEDDVDIHIGRRHAPSPVHYVESRPRPRSYFQGPSYLVPERTIITTRSRSRDRSRERMSSSSSAAPPPPPPPQQPVIINNRIYNEHSSDEEDHHHHLVRRRSHSRSRSSSYVSREDWELERTRRELDELKLVQRRKEEEQRAEKDWKDEAELKRAKRELDEIKRKEALAAEEKRIKGQIELERLREEERQDAEKKARDKAAQEAVEKYKQKEGERLAKEKKEKEERENEYKRRLQEDLINSGLDEKQIQAILKKEKVKQQELDDQARPTYTRMARRHLSIETLRTFRIEYDVDPDPDYVLIKRWVPEWEQDTLWKHTKHIREKRSKSILAIEDGHRRHHHHHHEPEFEWVRKKERKRSKSPALLMYLAGARPS